MHPAGQRRRKSEAHAAESSRLASLQQVAASRDAVCRRVQDVLLGLHRHLLHLPELAQATPVDGWEQLVARLGLSDEDLDSAAKRLQALTWADHLPEPSTTQNHILLGSFSVHLKRATPLPQDPSQGDAWVLDNFKTHLLRATPLPGASPWWLRRLRSSCSAAPFIAATMQLHTLH